MGKKRLCVFYCKAYEWLGYAIDWIICKECQRKLAKGIPLKVCFRAKNTAQKQ
jgi:hypothetical protein